MCPDYYKNIGRYYHTAVEDDPVNSQLQNVGKATTFGNPNSLRAVKNPPLPKNCMHQTSTPLTEMLSLKWFI